MSTYNLTVAGQPVKIIFTRINDSRRIPSIDMKKKPNLFAITGAMKCALMLPGVRFSYGISFCHQSDEFDPRKGRRRALVDAMSDLDVNGTLKGEIMLAFLTEEKRRIKVPGPERKPRTKRKPKRDMLIKMADRIADALIKLGNPIIIGPPEKISATGNIAAKANITGNL